MDYAKFLIDDTYNVDYVIYRFKNKVNGKVYIGQTTKPLRKRVIQHMTNSRPTTNVKKTYFHNALNKYGFENFDLDIIERCASQKELDEREIYWIAYYKSTDKKYGYNTDTGGRNGSLGRKLSEEHRAKLLAANLGHHRSEETKEQLRSVHKAKWEDPEYRNKHIANIMKVAGINKKAIYQYTLDGQFIKEWESGYAACEYIYGHRRGSLTNSIKRNLKQGKLGFIKKGFLWSTVDYRNKNNIKLYNYDSEADVA